ncbi:MAG TPA: choice-of-anchor J domain-containing protein, partial [Candidatus Cloacimonadota bacterium]|nr:choice-of-anchor J domain-containing protein [Candidatus Cloacimonadota bacterium]
VFDGTLDLNVSGDTVVDIDLDVPFAYDGNNLAIMVVRPLDSGYFSSLNKFYYTETPNYQSRTLYYMSDSVEPNPASPLTGTLVNNVPNTGFAFSTAGFASLNGVVSSNGTPVADVRVAVDGTARYTMTNAQGEYAMNLLIPGTVNLTATKFGYIDAHETGVVLTADETTVKNITINPVPTVTVSGQVNASDTSAGLAGATVKLTGYEDYEVESNASGAFTIPGVYANNTYTLKITAPGYQAHTQELAVAAANVTVPAITLNELANPPSGVVATPSPTQVDITWNAPGDGVDVWFSHTSLDTFSDAIGTGGAAQFEVAHRYSPAHLETYGVAGATLEKVQFMPHEPTATYGIKIYTGTAGSGPGPLAYTQAVSSVVVDEWNEVELGESVQIPSDTDLWIAIDINTPTGYPAGCDDGPAILGYGDMMYFQGAWSTLDDLAGIDANWMIKGFATGAAGPREFAISTGAHTPSETAYLATRNSQPAPFAKASANGEVVTRTNAPTENKPVFTQTANTRAITGYNVWRTPLATMNNESTWTQLATNLTVTQYTDATWAQVPTGEFKYVVKAYYTGGVASNPAFSNTVFKNMTATVNISLATADGGSPAGASVTLTNTDGNPDHSYTQTAASANVIFPQVWHGIYTITVAKVGYQTVIQENVIIAGESYTHPTITLPVSSIILTEGFEGTFPPTGWTIIDSDGDGHNWMQWDYTPHGGVYGVASGSYDNNIGQLFPDNWLITSQISLAPNTTNTLKFWVSPQDPSYAQDYYSVMVSTTNTQPASFEEIYSETIMGSDWEERTVNLPYAGQSIYVAFRHHDCTDWYIMKIDDIEIAGSEATGENVPSVLQTALVGNYPNPFNPTTTISYNLANDSHVSIDIYNVKGQKVKTLVNDRVTAGTHNVVWNGKDDSGKNVGSGIYFFNMKAGKYTSTRKMILMK